MSLGLKVGREQGRDRGLTLVELVVAGVLAGLVLAATLTVFSGAMRAVRGVAIRTSSAADTRVAMEQVTRELRVATVPNGTTAALISGTPSAVSFYSLLDRTGTAVAANGEPAPSRIDYAFNGSCLTRTLTPMLPSGTGWTPDGAHAVTGCLLRTSTAPVFGYYASGAIAVNGVDTPALAAGAGLAAATLPLVQSIEVTLTATTTTTTDVPAAQLRSRVTLTNVLVRNGG